MTLPESIVLHAKSLSEGGVLSPKEFLHLGSRAAVDQAFSRLTKEGKLLRIARGSYATPVSSRFGTRAPAPEKVVESLAARSGETMAPHGAAAANARKEQAALESEAGSPIEAHDWAFYSNRVRASTYNVDTAAMRPYFEAGSLPCTPST